MERRVGREISAIHQHLSLNIEYKKILIKTLFSRPFKYKAERTKGEKQITAQKNY